MAKVSGDIQTMFDNGDKVVWSAIQFEGDIGAGESAASQFATLRKRETTCNSCCSLDGFRDILAG